MEDTFYTEKVRKMLRELSGPVNDSAATGLAIAEEKRWDAWRQIPDTNSISKRLKNLLASGVSDIQKAYALTVLLVSRFDLLPFVWRIHNSSKNKGYPFLDIIDVTCLSERLLEFAGILACTSFDHEKGEEGQRAENLLKLMQKLFKVLPETSEASVEILKRLP